MIHLPALVDSGNLSLATVSMRTAVRCKATILPIHPRPVTQVVYQIDPPVINRFAILNICYGGLNEKLYAYILPDQGEDLILGQGWLIRHDASTRPARNEVLIRLPFPLTLTATDKTSDTADISARAVRIYRARAMRTGSVRIFSATLHDIEKALRTKVYTDPRVNCPDWLLPVVDAFDRKKAAQLPQHRPGLDTEIRLVEGEHLPPLALCTL